MLLGRRASMISNKTVQNPAVLREFLLAFADDEHLMGQQHTDCIGVTPFLEEDLAFSSIGQDELGHAVMLYELVCELDDVEPTDRAIDALAFDRGADDYRSSAFTEYVTTDWAEALLRHWMYDLVEEARWDLVVTSSHVPLANVSVRAHREETYHRRHAQALIDSLIETPARAELERGLSVVLPKLPTLLSSVANEGVLIGEGVLAGSLATKAPAILERISAAFPGAVLGQVPDDGRTARSEHFAPLLARMREVLDLDPSAVW